MTSGDISRTDLESAHEEWDYTQTVNHVMGHEYPVSIPCQLRFTEDPKQDTERFHEALDERGYSFLDSDADRYHVERNTVHYDGEVMIREKFHRLRVMVFRGGLVRLFPHDDYIPTVDELERLAEALEVGFSAGLEHHPIEREAEA